MNRKILVIEDSLDSREMITDALEFAGFTVLQSTNGEDGEKQALEQCPDVILLDLTLPQKSGWEVAQSLRHIDSLKEIPIIALTAHARQEDRQRALGLGFNSFLTKPIKPKEVIKEINRYLK